MCHRVKTRREDRAAGANDDDDVFGKYVIPNLEVEVAGDADEGDDLES